MAPAAPPSGYWQLSLTTAADTAEGLVNLMWELGALGVIEEEEPGRPPRLRAFFARTAPPEPLGARVREYTDGLRALGFSRAGGPTVSALDDEGWADAWRRHFRPVAVGRALLVVPPWEEGPANGRTVLTIEPGRAFGTGHHGSTAGCLEALESIMTRAAAPRRVLDLGTGSGILAIAAARLGAPAVLAVDDDPDAVALALANVARNHVADRVRCVLGDALELQVSPVELVTANLLTAAHLRLAPRAARYLVPGGTVIAGGILDAERFEVRLAFETHGFEQRATVSRDGWTTLELRYAPLRDRA